MTPRLAAVSLVVLTLVLPVSAATRMTYDINGRPTAIEWAPTAFPLAYEVDRRLSELDAKIPGMIDHAFAAWAAIPDANLRFEPRGLVQSAARRNDGRLAVVLADELMSGQGALAMTTYTFDGTGRFIDADIQIDPSLLKGDFNVDSALRHEVGHLLGLDHSAVLSSVMFPYVNPANTPSGFDSDDRIAIANAYPKNDPTFFGATLQGRVIGDQGGVFAAQVVAINERGEPVSTALSDATGEFTLVGLPRGNYRLYAEPLDGPVEVSALQGTWRQAKTVSFPTKFYEGAPITVENGKVYGNLVVNTAGSMQLNPRWVGRVAMPNGSLSLTTSPAVVRAGETVTLGVAGDGFTSGMTEFEILNPAFRRVSDFTWSGNYVTATFALAGDAQPGSSVILVRNGNDSATLTGALRVQRGEKTRSVRR